ncbi:MAG: glycosyl hydrolase family 28-related protein [Acidimicrobiia bacterium]
MNAPSTPPPSTPAPRSPARRSSTGRSNTGRSNTTWRRTAAAVLAASVGAAGIVVWRNGAAESTAPAPAQRQDASATSAPTTTAVYRASDATTLAWPARPATTSTTGLPAATVPELTTTASTIPVINPRAFGAVGDGATDDTAALQAAFDAAPPGARIELPSGVYVQSELLYLRGVGVTLTGPPDAEIRAVRADRQAIVIQGNGNAIERIKLSSTATERRVALEDHRILLDEGSVGTRVEQVHVDGGSAAGILAHGASDYVIRGNLVENTKADGIHNTYGSTRGLVEHNVVRNSGDDCYAVVSYRRDDALTTDVIIQDNVCEDSHARGISVVGGQDVAIARNTVTLTRAAGIYLASEDSFDTYGTQRIRVIDNTITNANHDPALQHAAIFMYARAGTAAAASGEVALQVQDVLVDNNRIIDTINTHGHVALNNGFVDRIVIERTTINASDEQTPPLYTASDVGSYVFTGTVYNGELLEDETVDELLAAEVRTTTSG